MSFLLVLWRACLLTWRIESSQTKNIFFEYKHEFIGAITYRGLVDSRTNWKGRHTTTGITYIQYTHDVPPYSTQTFPGKNYESYGQDIDQVLDNAKVTYLMKYVEFFDNPVVKYFLAINLLVRKYRCIISIRKLLGIIENHRISSLKRNARCMLHFKASWKN